MRITVKNRDADSPNVFAAPFGGRKGHANGLGTHKVPNGDPFLWITHQTCPRNDERPTGCNCRPSLNPQTLAPAQSVVSSGAIGLSPKTPNESGSRQQAGNQAGVLPQPTPGFPPPRRGGDPQATSPVQSREYSQINLPDLTRLLQP